MTIKDAGAEPGGMMRYGIPKYRLPRDILDAEINRILAMGVTLEPGSVVTDLAGAMESGGFHAAFAAAGAHIGRRTYTPAGDSARILDAVSILRSTEGQAPPMLGRRVAVYGGGNTAMDAARTARRLGASEAVVVYRRTRDKMPAQPAPTTPSSSSAPATIRSTTTTAKAAASAPPNTPAAPSR